MGKRFGALRMRIALLLLLIIAPLAALAVSLELAEEKRDAAEAREQERATVRRVTSDLNRLLESTRDLVVGLSRNFVVPPQPEICNAQLASLKPAFPQFVNLVVVDNHFNVICDAYNPTGMRRLPLLTENPVIMARVRQTRKPDVGVFVKTPPNGLVIPLIGPVVGKDGEVRDIFFVTLDLKWLDDRINQIDIPEGSMLLVMDRRGTLVARNPRSDAFPVGSAAPRFQKTLAGRSDPQGDARDEGGVDRVYSVARLGADNALTVVMSEKAAEILRPAQQRLALHLAGLGGVGLLVLGLAWVGSDRYLTRPLSSLIKAADRLTAGDRSARSGVEYVGEIGGLARSFDIMASTLEQERITTLRTARVFRSIVEGTSAATGDEFFRSLVANLTSTLGADLALVGELNPDLRSLRTLAMCADGRILPKVDYELAGTPCGDAVNLDACRDAMLREYGMQSYLVTPLVNDNGRTIGLIAVMHRRATSGDGADSLSMLKVFAARAGMELTRLRVERELRESLAERKLVADLTQEMVRTLRALTAKLESVREEERTYIAREIHDELGQQLTAMRFSLKSAGASLPCRVEELTALVDSMIGSVRRIATELRPRILDAFGVVAAIEWLADDFGKRTGIDCRYKGLKDLTVHREIATAVFRICQESLTNIARHAQATEARVRLERDAEWLTLVISDNGKGMAPEELANTRSLGVVGMRERARMAGGELVVDTTPGRGVSVRLRLPLDLSLEGPAA